MTPPRHQICMRTRRLPAVCLHGYAFICGIAFTAELPAMGRPVAATVPAARLLSTHPYALHVTEASQHFGIPEHWIWAVMRAESDGQSRAVSHAGAMGLMQIMPGTWAMLSARFHLGPDPFDIRANILGGAAYLRLMWDRYGDVALMLAAYNAGPGRVDDYRLGRRRLPAETANYVTKISSSLGTAAMLRVTSSPHAVTQSWRHAPVFASRHNGASAMNKAPESPPVRPTQASPEDAFNPHLKVDDNQLFVPISPRKP